MAPRAESRSPLARLTLAAVALLALLTVVALATRAGLGGSGGRPEPDSRLLDRLFTVFLVLFLIYVPVAAWLYWTQRHVLRAELAKRSRRPSNVRSLIALGVALLLAIGINSWRHRLGDSNPNRQQPAKAAKPGARKAQRPSTRETSPHVDWAAFAVVSGLAVTGIAAAIVAARRRARFRDEPSVDQRLDLALAESLDDLLSDRDPRHAVIAAYARMERALAAAGIARDAHETPFEFVDRALRELDVGEASVQRLTELYERARFSTHEIDEPMRAAAVAALARIRDELRAEADGVGSTEPRQRAGADFAGAEGS